MAGSSSSPSGFSRRAFTRLAGAAAVAAVVSPGLAGRAEAAAPGAARGAAKAADPDDTAALYRRVLLDHTRWTETQWDEAAGHYAAKDFGFAVVLGHALLLTRGTFDAEAAGVDEAVLRSRTLATLRHFAASNRLNGGDEWGKQLFFDTTFQLYFVLAARLLWDELDAETRANVDALVRAQAAYTTSLGTGDDPLSKAGGWTPNGLKGGYVGDTKLEEMGVYAQSLAPALAWAADDARAADWSAAYGRWSRNETGLPEADLTNPRTVDGVPVAANTARNLYDTFIVENHGSFGPHYQCELWRTSGRNAVHFLTAGRPLPEVLTHQPNGTELWTSLLLVMSDAGEPLMPMVNDREHLYGRDVIPVAFLAQVLGDRAAARAEEALASRLTAYQAYPPVHRITKFSGEPKYEPEARAEVAISYLLHEWRAAHGGAVRPLTDAQLFERARGVRDFGEGPGLVAHQSPAGWAGAVSKPKFVKFAWQPGHDDWLFRLSGATPMFLPASSAKVTGRSVALRTALRDGFEATATVLELDSSARAGFATLPGGEVVYASTGAGDGEGHLEVFNLSMPGMPGLDGGRRYDTAEGSVTVPAGDAASGAAVSSRGGWIGVDGRAGLVVRGASNPLTVRGDAVMLSDGPAEALLVEGYPDGSPAALEAARARPAPVAADGSVRASSAGGQLTVFNLSGSAVRTTVSVPSEHPGEVRLFEGASTVAADGADVEVALGAAAAQVLAFRFALRGADGGRPPVGLRAVVRDAATVELGGAACRVTVAAADGSARTVAVPAEGVRRVVFEKAVPWPLRDAALGRPVFPTVPLPSGMSDPAAAVDGSPASAWDPGRDGRMVVDLGAAVPFASVTARWTGGRVPAADVAVSADGITYSTLGRLRVRGRGSALAKGATARYVALNVVGRGARDARLVALSVEPR